MTYTEEEYATYEWGTIKVRDEMRAGSATFLVKGPEIEWPDAPFLDWLKERGYSIWRYSRGHFAGVTWVWVNLKTKKYVLGMPGVRRAEEIGNHAITVEEFKTILAIFDKYEGKSPLDMG